MVHPANSAALWVCASQEGWQGSVQDLARLLGTRFGLDAEPLFTTLVAGGEVILAEGVSPEDAQYLCDVLSRMGIRGIARAPAAPVVAATAAPSRPDVQDTILDARGVGRAPSRDATTVGRDVRPTFEADHRSVNLSHSDLPIRGAARPQETLQWTQSQQYELEQLAASDVARRAATPHRSPGSIDESLPAEARHVVDAPATPPVREAIPEEFDEAFGEVWSSLLADPEPGAPARDPTRLPLASAKPAGWATVLGESLTDVPATAPPSHPPSLEDALEDRTSKWEISFEAVDLDEEFSKSADDLLRELGDSVDVMRVSTEELLRATDIDEPPPPAFEVSRAPEPVALARAMSTPRAIPARNPTDGPHHKAWLSGLLSAVVPGAGQVYNGQVGKGLLFGLASIVVVPWLLSVVDAVTIGKHISAGRLRPRNAGRPVFVAIFCLVVGPSLALAAYQGGAAIAGRLAQPGSLLADPDADRNEAIQARGAATIEIERAMYRADRARAEVEAELERNQTPMPGHPAYGLTERERARRASTMISRAQAACDSKDAGGCLRLVNEALALDPSNKLGWSLLVRARKAQPNWIPPSRTGTDVGGSPADAGIAPPGP
jgi:hypothetical protein